MYFCNNLDKIALSHFLQIGEPIFLGVLKCPKNITRLVEYTMHHNNFMKNISKQQTDLNKTITKGIENISQIYKGKVDTLQNCDIANYISLTLI